MNMNHELGPRQLAAVNEAILSAELKAKSRTELTSRIDENGERVEHSSTYTQPLGHAAPEVLAAITEILATTGTINKNNYQTVIKQIDDFTEKWQIPIDDKRKSIEELRTERSEREQQRTAEEERRKQEDDATHAAGELTTHDKITLGTKEIARLIREQLAKEYPSLTFSVTMERGPSSITIALMRSTGERIIRRFEDIDADAIEWYTAQHRSTIEGIKTNQESRYHQLNHFEGREEYRADRWNNGVFLTKHGYDIFKRVADIASYYNYDHSDIQTDYFDVNFYLSLHIGRWDKPYVHEDAPVAAPTVPAEPPATGSGATIRRNLDKDGLEIRFPSRPEPEVLERLKAAGFRWSRFAGVWYKRYSEGLELRAQALINGGAA
jgi:hypothetical protein